MKISKSDTGTKIQISQKEWESIGKKAGWTKEAYLTSPVKPQFAPQLCPVKGCGKKFIPDPDVEEGEICPFCRKKQVVPHINMYDMGEGQGLNA